MFIKYNMETLRNVVYENKDSLTSAYRESEMDNDIKLVVDIYEFYGNVRYVFQIVDSCLVPNFRISFI